MHRACLLAFATVLLASCPTRAAGIPEEAVRRAVDRGVASLRKAQSPDGSFPIGGVGTGATSLAALTLLECGVSPEDEQLRKAVAAVRAGCPTSNQIYSVA